MKILVGAIIVAGLLALPFVGAKYEVLYNKTAGTELSKSIVDRDRETFKNSKAYIENSVQTLHSYKMQYDIAKDEDKEIIANNIRNEFANFDADKINNANLRHFLLNIQGGKL